MAKLFSSLPHLKTLATVSMPEAARAGAPWSTDANNSTHTAGDTPRAQQPPPHATLAVLHGDRAAQQPGSTCAILVTVSIVGLRELRQDASDLVRRVEAGEEITITVAGRPSARLIAAASQRWRSFDAVAELFDGPEDTEWELDRDRVDQAVRDPWTTA